MKKAPTKPLGWIAAQTRFLYFPLFILILVNISASVCSVYFALLSRDVVNAAVEGTGIILGALKLAGLILVEIVLRVLNSRLTVAFGGRLEMNLRKTAFDAVLHKKWTELQKYHSGEVVNRVKNDSSVIASGVMHILPNGAMLITKVIGAVIVLIGIDWQFALILCTCAPIILCLGRLYSKKMKLFHKAVQQSEGKAISFMGEAVQNITVLKAFGSENGAVSEMEDIQKETLRLRLKRNAWSLIANVSLLIMFTGSYAFAVIWGAFKLRMGMSFGSFTAMLQLVNQVQSPFRSIGSLFVNYQNMLASAERIMEMISRGGESVIDKSEGLYDRMNALVFKNVSFSYGGEKVLDEASFRINRGDFVALAGISGGGKSTSFRLLLGLCEPESGEIYFDCGEKVSLGASTRKMFGYVPQGNMLLSGSVEKNIDFYGNISESDIQTAAKDANIYDVIASLPDGFETALGEKGAGLSEGQIQRVAVARALARKAPILLLDEATSALDEETEMKLLTSLKEKSDKTVIIITHRKKVFDFCDKIITLENGKFNC